MANQSAEDRLIDRRTVLQDRGGAGRGRAATAARKRMPKRSSNPEERFR